MILAEDDGEVLAADARLIRMRYDNGDEREYPLLKFVRSNQGTCINQRPTVADAASACARARRSPTAHRPARASWRSARACSCAFMTWQGYNFEDAIILSEALVRDDKFTSIHIEKHEVESRDTKLGPGGDHARHPERR